ncbi:MAG: CDP-alcohol phosphatidyltransferase family protein [Chloroflexi bacterium]|nr:CDP-alcohol phosphatidyltransferase family protein [Chloroflexota bacterium]
MGDRSFVSSATRDRLRISAQPLAVAVGRLGFSPNALTVLGFLISVVAAALAGLSLWLAAGIVGLLGAAFDMLDGGLARATGRTSKLGGFLDSTFDRWGEAVVYAGIIAGALLIREPLTGMLAAGAMSSAFMVSYTRAKAEALGFRGEVGIAPRPERVAILTAGLVLSGLTGGPAVGPWLQISLGVLLLTTTITTIQRILYVREQAAEAEVDR